MFMPVTQRASKGNIDMMKKFFIVIMAFCLAACGAAGKTVGLNEMFAVKKGETVNIRGTALNLKMLENGTAKVASEGDSAFCKIEVKYKGFTEEKTLEEGAFAAYDELNIRLEKVNMAIDASRATCVFTVGKTLG